MVDDLSRPKGTSHTLNKQLHYGQIKFYTQGLQFSIQLSPENEKQVKAFRSLPNQVKIREDRPQTPTENNAFDVQRTMCMAMPCHISQYMQEAIAIDTWRTECRIKHHL